MAQKWIEDRSSHLLKAFNGPHLPGFELISVWKALKESQETPC